MTSSASPPAFAWRQECFQAIRPERYSIMRNGSMRMSLRWGVTDGAVKRLALGSVASKIIRLATCAVLVAPIGCLEG